MYSKAIKWTLSGVLSIGLVGCSDFLEGKKEKKEIIELSDDKFSCLQSLPENIRKISEGDAHKNEIETSTTCIQEALIYFQKRTKGAKEGAYSIPELRAFFGKYFLKENNVSPVLALELMKLKKALLGGSAQEITKDEITRLVAVLDTFKVELRKVHTHIKILTMQRAVMPIRTEQTQQATAVLESALIRVVQDTELTRSEYSFSDAKKLFSAISDFVTGDEPFNLYLKASSYVPIVEATKKILFGEKAELRAKEDWIQAIKVVLNLYSIALRFYYETPQLRFDSSEQIKAVLEMADMSLNLLSNSPRMLSRGEISFDDIDELIRLLKEEGIFVVPVSTETIQETYRVVVAKILEAERRQDITGVYSLKVQHLKVLRREFEILRMHQEIFEEQLKASTPLRFEEFYKRLEKVKVENWIRLQDGLDISLQNALKKSWRDTLQILGSDHVILYNSQGKTLMERQTREKTIGWQNIAKINLMRTLARMLNLGYSNGNSMNLDRSWIDEAGLTQWYEDFNSLGTELKAFDPRSGNAGARSFKEANFFTFDGDGDKAMSLRETYQFVSVLFSGGLESSSHFQRVMGDLRCEVGEKDIFQFNKFAESCFKQHLFDQFDKVFNNLPGMTRYLQTMPLTDRETFYQSLMTASRVSDPSRGLVEMGDVRAMVMLLHYIDAVFVVYDKDGNGQLNRTELSQASQRFIHFLRDRSPGTSDANLRDAFAYLVVEGKVPSGWNVVQSKFGRWFNTDIEADRRSILKVIEALKSDLK